ncbi:MAG: DUF2911 domain-containing protein [Cyclobacteriaceae bacterium]|nr:DUF2911 domain-containing protein [Cyclobacteriaceae bacterium]
MIKKILIVLGLLLLSFVGYIAYEMLFPKSPKASASFNDADLSITVSYGQPSKKGRLIFGEEKDGALQPYGKYWRLGANAPTEITFNKDILFADQPVKAGTYRMYAVPGADSFEISLNSQVGSFSGAPEPDYSLDVVKVKIPVAETAETEKFVISFTRDGNAVNMDLVWDQTLVRVPVTIQ